MSVSKSKETAPLSPRAGPPRNGNSWILHQRQLPAGAEVVSTGGAHFRVWAPRSATVGIRLGYSAAEVDAAAPQALLSEDGGYFSGHVPGAAAGMLYRVQLEGGSYPDPATRFQPDGPHGPSQIIDPRAYRWDDRDWKGTRSDTQIIYEMHVGTFTPEGTWPAAAEQLPHLAALGITIVELMPVAEFAGRFGWGYDGVNWFAPSRVYGTPDEFRAFVDRAHREGLAVILDVVYNHFGPDGNYLKEFSADYFSSAYANEWGEAINFDGPNSGPVRELTIANAGYWIDEFHLDGLRLDATQQIFDRSSEHIVAAIAEKVRAAAKGRGTYVVAENETQHTKLVRSKERGGYGIDALWNDDFHHTARVALTGRAEAYYSDYRGTPQEFISCLKWGYLYQGQRYAWQKQRRGTPALDLEPWQFVNCLQNHDQVANSLRGARIHQLTSPGRLRAMTALLLLGPGSPMLFQGQEFAADSCFLYFADHHPDLAKLVSQGRSDFLAQFPSIARAESVCLLAQPQAEETFQRSKLDLTERAKHAAVYALHRDLIHLRRHDPVLTAPKRGAFDGAVLSPQSFLLRFFGPEGDDRLLIVNLGVDLRLEPAPEPLLAPPVGQRWGVKWSSEDPRYGGTGTPAVEPMDIWQIPGEAAVVLAPANDERKEYGQDHSPNRSNQNEG
ncbi:MAG: malto-oligosyltrehalose trehalohydrolase [Verrucomicrobiota bacterium]